MNTLALRTRAIHRKVSLVHIPRIRIPWRAVYFLGILFSLAMLIWYVVEVNELTQGAYLIKNYQKEITALSEENKMLETSFAESGFLGSAMQRVQGLHFEKTTDVTYVQLLEDSLARAK